METVVKEDQELRFAKNAVARAHDEYGRAISPHAVKFATEKIRQAEEEKRRIHRERLSKLT